MSDSYQINELFTSVQGEGVHAGKRASFIRLQGCTVSCPWCDTKYTWAKGGKKMTVEEIMKWVNLQNSRHIVITGGEPTLYNLDPLLAALGEANLVTQLETSGQNPLKGELRPKWVTWSPKPNLEFDAPVEIKYRADEVKWVVDDDLQWETVWSTWKNIYMFAFSNQVFTHLPYFVLMPEGTPPTEKHIGKALEWMDRVPLRVQEWWRMSDRLHFRFGVK